jgi:hypothetical protein
MHVSIRHREKTAGLLRRYRQIEVITSVRFSELEKSIIRKRQLDDFVVLKRHPDSRRSNNLLLLGQDVPPDGFPLLVSDLLMGRPNFYVCDTPVHAKIYEEALGEAFKALKSFIDDNAMLSEPSTFDF